jgi:hypothetical protein
MGQRSSPAAGLKSSIQVMCQRSNLDKIVYKQRDINTALHQMDRGSCLLQRQKFKK